MKLDLLSYKHIVFLTGAGVSAASGLPTYRGEGGVWRDHNIEEYGSLTALKNSPDKIWKAYGSLRKQLSIARPNKAHLILAKLESRKLPDQSFTVITQNVDGLHQKAGSQNVLELHGNLAYSRCSNDRCDKAVFKDDHSYERSIIPYCTLCNSVIRPDIVLFGEQLPVDAEWQSKIALRNCDLFVAVGTSGTVSPASNFVRSADFAGAMTVYINTVSMEVANSYFHHSVIGDAGDMLERVFLWKKGSWKKGG